MSLISISGHLKDAFGNPLAAAPVTFRLYNYNGNLPTVSATNILVPIVVELITDNTGLYSGTIQGNDTISPTGTVYEVNFGGGASASYSFSGAGPINLDSYPPVSSVPVPTGPVPANILGGNNTFTGANVFHWKQFIYWQQHPQRDRDVYEYQR